MNLNQRAAELCQHIVSDAQRLRADVQTLPGGTTVVDLGVRSAGGLEAGRRLAEVCLAGLGQVAIVPAPREVSSGPAVQVYTDHPIAACMASQYAGWQITGEKFFAMGSGPMRAVAGKEALFDHIGHRETSSVAVGVLESGKLPPAAVVDDLIRQCKVAPAGLTLLVARTASQAGTVQVVARSIETALHKLGELGFDLKRVQSGYGLAPLPPVAPNDLAGIGRTNDAILYGGEATLWVRGDDASLEEIGPQVPSNSSSDHGRPFSEIFERYGRDFYQIDPHLFSPAVVTFHNLDSGRTWRFGQLVPELLRWA